MQELKEKILSEGKICPNNIVKVDSFLNHQLDVELLRKMGEEFKRLLGGLEVNKILTIESSGIAVACYVAEAYKCRLVFAKKGKSLNQSTDFYESNVYSYTRQQEYPIRVSKEFLHESDKVFIVDDFLANGAALNGLIDIVNASGATLVGCGCVIEKGFQPGGQKLRDRGIKVLSLAIIDSIDEVNQKIIFRN